MGHRNMLNLRQQRLRHEFAARAPKNDNEKPSDAENSKAASGSSQSGFLAFLAYLFPFPANN